MCSESRDLLRDACDWIRANPDATNFDVTEDQLAIWSFDGEFDGERPAGFYLAVFTFGLLAATLSRGGTNTKPCLQVSVARIIELFPKWQLKLGLAELHRRTELKSVPLPLFTFPENEAIDFSWECIEEGDNGRGGR